MELDDELYNEKLKCCLEGYEVDFLTHEVSLRLMPAHTTDMIATLRFAKDLDPKVQAVVCRNHGIDDYVYIKQIGDLWSIHYLKDIKNREPRRWQ